MAEVYLAGVKLGSLSAQEVWDLSLKLRDFSISNAGGFSASSHSLIKIHGRQFNVLPLLHPAFWELVNAGKWEPETYQIFNRFLNAQTVFLDIGAWIGSTAFYGAQIAAQTLAFEPDPVSFAKLKANFDANRNTAWYSKLQIYSKAISPTIGKISLGSKNRGGDSMSSTLFQDENHSWKVDSIDLFTLLEKEKIYDKPFFIKMDIEGGEYSLIPSLKVFFESQNTSILLALHPEFLIESIGKSTKGIFKHLRVRYTFYKKHAKVLDALPFDRIEHADGRPFNKRKYLLKAFIFGSFPHTIVGYNA